MPPDSRDHDQERRQSVWLQALSYAVVYLAVLPVRLVCHLTDRGRRKPAGPQIETDAVAMPISSLADLAVDTWRLERWLAGLDTDQSIAPGRFVVRQLRAFLHGFELETVDLTGHKYEPGLAVELVGNVYDETMPDGVAIVDEMVTPLCLWRGKVVRLGKLVTRSSATSSASGE
jgi:hypothetical protein